MPFIENCSRVAIKQGDHFDPGKRSILIQITEFDGDFPVPKHNFEWVYQFSFDDTEDESERAIQPDQAKRLAYLLVKAKELSYNVIVHCHAGLCRSGAVAVAGEELGFDPADRIKLPNTRVLNMLRKELGLAINEDTSMFAQDFYNRIYD